MYWACHVRINLMNSTQTSQENHWAGVALLGLCFAMIGWMGGFAWVHRATIADLWLEASEQRYLTMTGEAGPVTYLVTHTDIAAMEAYAFERDEVLGVEVYELPDKVAVAFTKADSSSIEALNVSEFVVAMHQKIIPMMCH